jgi:dihydrofolate reductase
MKNLSHPRLSMVVAMSQNRVIGKNNQLPWHLPADLKHFKHLTMGHPIIMGRKTYESIGKPLPGRDNIILTRDASFEAPGCIVVTSINEALESADLEDLKEIFIIGGTQIYQALLPRVERIYLTLVHHHFDGDAFFPELDKKIWLEKICVNHLADEANPYPYSFLIYERIKHT